jgi:carbamoyltransferase
MTNKKKYLLGVSYGHHESSVCLVSQEGQWEYLREDGLSRVKGDSRFPVLSAHYLLKSQRVDVDQIVGVCLHEKPLRSWLGHGLEKGLTPDHYHLKAQHLRGANIGFADQVKEYLGLKSNKVHYSNHYVSHYLNALSFVQNAGPHLCLVMDGYGEGGSGSVFFGDGQNWKEVKRFSVGQSLGLLYSALTSWVGYQSNADEHKVMALCAYGDPVHYDFIRQNIILGQGSDYFLSKKYINNDDVSVEAFTTKFCQKFGDKNSSNVFNHMNSAMVKSIADVVASFQLVIECIVIEIIEELTRNYQKYNTLLLSGGLFLNVKLVSKITKKMALKRVVVPPSPGDAGSSIGAARFISDLLGWSFESIGHAFCGPVLQSLNDFPNIYKKRQLSDVDAYIDEQLYRGLVLPFYQGRSECGPRSLGVRSLIVGLDSKESVQHLNQVTKRREAFRPIAPMMSHVMGFNDLPQSDFIISKWMGTLINKHNILNIRPDHLNNIAHQDGTLRAQILTAEDMKAANLHSSLTNQLNAGVMLGNTSLNIAGDPTVFTPLDLYVNLRRMSLNCVYSDDGVYELL